MDDNCGMTTPLLLEQEDGNESLSLPYGIERGNNNVGQGERSSLIVDSTMLSNNSNQSNNNSYSWISILRIFIVPAIGGLLFGYDISSTSFVLVELTKSSTTTLSSFIQGLIVSASAFGATVGSFLLYYLNIPNYVGRRYELRYSSLLYWFGIILQILAGYIWSKVSDNENQAIVKDRNLSLGLLFIGRIVYGFGIALAMHSGPTYLAEMIPSSIRGIFVSCKEVFIVLGIIFGYMIGYYYSSNDDDENINNSKWIRLYYYSLLLSTVMYILSFTIPESTRWLLFTLQKYDESYQSISFIYPNNPTKAYDELMLLQTEHRQYEEQQTLLLHETNCQEENYNNDDVLLSSHGESIIIMEQQQNETISIWSKQYRYQLIAGIGLVTLQQITGQPSVLSYATFILQHAHVSNYFTIWLGLFKLLATLLAALTVELYGRRKLLYIGTTFMLVSLMVLTLNGSSSTSSSSSSFQDILSLIALFIYVGGYQFSFGPITWLIVSEVFPFKIRGTAVAISVTMNFLVNSIVQLFIPIIQHYFGYNTTFGVFTLLTAYSIYFVSVFVPETKGLTLEQIEQTFSQ